MFRRGRGRPLLGAAVIVGASRSAARHEVERQGERTAQMQLATDREAEKQRREEEERERRTLSAIDEAIAKERSRNDQAGKVSHHGQAGMTERGVPDQMEEVPPYSSHDDMKGAKGRYCPACGHMCKHEDKFCAKCGTRQPTDDGEQMRMA